MVIWSRERARVVNHKAAIKYSWQWQQRNTLQTPVSKMNNTYPRIFRFALDFPQKFTVGSDKQICVNVMSISQ